jgi:hypothetical protein
MILTKDGQTLPYGQDVTFEVDGEEYVISYASLLASEEAREQAGVETAEPPAPTLVEAKLAKNRAVTAKREAVFSAGYTPATGPLAGHTLQCRDVQDRTNWLTSAVGYSAAVQAGAGNVAGATFRTQDNETVTITYAEAATVLLQGMQIWGADIMQRSWELKDEIDAAEDQAELDAIDVNTGWPE